MSVRRAAGPTVDQEAFGTAPDGPVTRFIVDSGSIQVTILTYGGILQSIRVPDRHGVMADVSLGFANLIDYVERSPYLGNITGRYANRIAGGRFTLDGTAYQLPVNDGPNSLHGGTAGFDRRVWAATPFQTHAGAGVRLGFTSPAMDQGYPGTLATTVTYTVIGAGAGAGAGACACAGAAESDSGTGGGSIRIDYEATTDAPTVVNLTNHALFNLAGEGAGSIEAHLLRLNADHYLPVDRTLIPTGQIRPVAGTPMDFTTQAPIGSRIRDRFDQLVLARGYDHTYVLNRSGPGTCHAATVTEPGSGRTLTVRTTEPGVQLYSGNFLDGQLAGTSGRAYRQADGFALETQHFPDSPNQPDFPSTVLRPGQTYQTTTSYQFGVTTNQQDG